MQFSDSILEVRRVLLKYLVPEFVWPRQVFIDGVAFNVRNTPYSFGIKYLFTRRPEVYEQAERSFLSSIEPGDRVLELGSSIGILTRLIRERTGPAGSVLAVEASSKLTSYSRTWLEQFPNVRIVNKYAFPVHRNIPLSFSFNDLKGSLGGSVNFGSDVNDGKRSDTFFIEDGEKEFNFYANILICDIEGSEVTLLQAEASLPAYLQKIIIELHPDIYSENTAFQIIVKLEAFGFKLQASLHSVYYFQRNT